MIDIDIKLDSLLETVEHKVNKLNKKYIDFFDDKLIFNKDIKYDITFFKDWYFNPIISKYTSIIWDGLEICSDYNLRKQEIIHEILTDPTYVSIDRCERYFQINNVLTILHYIQPVYDFYIKSKLIDTWNLTASHINLEDNKHYFNSFTDESLINIKFIFHNNILVKLENEIKTKILDTSFLESVYNYFYDVYYSEVNMDCISYQSYKDLTMRDILYRNYIKHTLAVFNNYFESLKNK